MSRPPLSKITKLLSFSPYPSKANEIVLSAGNENLYLIKFSAFSYGFNSNDNASFSSVRFNISESLSMKRLNVPFSSLVP